MAEVRGGRWSDETAAATAAAEPGPQSSTERTSWPEVAFRASTDALAIVTGRELRCELLNEAFRALCPSPIADLAGARLAEVGPATTVPFGELAAAVLAEGGTADGETELVDPSGRRRWFGYVIRRIETGRQVAVLIALRETTELVEARWAAVAAASAADRRAAELGAIMEAIPDGVMVFDAAGTLVRMNAAAAETWRRAGVDTAAIGDAFAHFELRAEDGRPLPRHEWPVRRALAGERVQGVHLRFAPQAARAIWMLASAAPIRGADGKIAGAVLEFSDETSVRDLAEARDDLVRMVTHDLRTPLSVVYAQAHLIRRGSDAGTLVADRAAAIERSCERMSGMIQDLVEVTLLEAGQLPMSVARVDVAALLPDILHGMRGGLPVDRVKLRPCADCWAMVDPARLERIVVNLVSNALKYSAGEVLVGLDRTPDAVTLSVSDAGVGISPEDQARVFERYFRASAERRPEGLGLGLYITRLLAEGQGGRVEVESELGKGSTFRVVFPATPAQPSAT